MRALRRHRTGDANVDRLQDALQDWSKQFDKVPFLDGVQVDVVLSAGANTVQHKLGRKPRGWFLIRRIRGTAASYPSETGLTENNLVLDAAGSEAVSIWVF